MNNSESNFVLEKLFAILENHFKVDAPIVLKKSFIVITELIQNIAEYNIIRKTDFPNTQITFEVNKDNIILICSNKIEKRDESIILRIFNGVDSLDRKGLEKKYKEGLFNRKSLGLLMVKLLESSNFKWEVETVQDKNQYNRLKTELIIKYGGIAH